MKSDETPPERPFWMDPGEELRLVKAARAGKVSAYSQLAERHRATLFRVIYAVTRSERGARAVVAATEERGAKGIRHMPEHQRFLPWWIRIARNLAVARARRLAAGGPAATPDPPTAVTSGRMSPAAARRLDRALAGLGLDDQFVLALRWVEGLSCAEIERVMMLPQGSVPARVSQARGSIEDRLGTGDTHDALMVLFRFEGGPALVESHAEAPGPPAIPASEAALPPVPAAPARRSRDLAPQLVSAALGVLLVASVAGLIVLLGRAQQIGGAAPTEVRHAGAPAPGSWPAPAEVPGSLVSRTPATIETRTPPPAASVAAPTDSAPPAAPSAPPRTAPAPTERAAEPAPVRAEPRRATTPPAVRKPPSRAAMGLLCGEVTDEEGAPVAGARILLADMEVGEVGVVTDRRGRFCVSAPRGDRTVSVVALGFATHRLLVTMEGQTASLSIRLRSSSLQEVPGPR